MIMNTPATDALKKPRSVLFADGIVPVRALVRWAKGAPVGEAPLVECQVVEASPGREFCRVVWSTTPLDQTWEISEEIMGAIVTILDEGLGLVIPPGATQYRAQNMTPGSMGLPGHR